MKMIGFTLLVIPLVLLLSSCQTADKAETTPLAESMKGYELYSWQEGNQWRLSLLVGTNREKSLNEIRSNDNTLPDIDTLISTLEKVPSGQYITWSSRETLSFPPDSIIKQIEKICEENGLILSIVK
jgi:hypothetical protein